MAQQRAAVATQQIMATADRRLERNDRLLQARMEKLVRTRHHDAADPTKYMRTSAEISAEASALIKETLAHVGDDRGRRPGESMADWLARVKD
jgi:hypothetical protein